MPDVCGVFLKIHKKIGDEFNLLCKFASNPLYIFHPILCSTPPFSISFSSVAVSMQRNIKMCVPMHISSPTAFYRNQLWKRRLV